MSSVIAECVSFNVPSTASAIRVRVFSRTMILSTMMKNSLGVKTFSPGSKSASEYIVPSAIARVKPCAKNTADSLSSVVRLPFNSIFAKNCSFVPIGIPAISRMISSRLWLTIGAPQIGQAGFANVANNVRKALSHSAIESAEAFAGASPRVAAIAKLAGSPSALSSGMLRLPPSKSAAKGESVSR